MESSEVKQILKTIGIPVGIVVIIIIVAAGFYIYRQVQDAQIADLTIQQLKREKRAQIG